MADFTKPGKKKRKLVRAEEATPDDLFEGGSAKWSDERKKAVARTLANMSVRQAIEEYQKRGFSAAQAKKDIKAARTWYGSTKIKGRINARHDITPDSRPGTTGGTSGETWAPEYFVKDPKTGKMVPPASGATSKGKGRGGTGKLNPIDTTEEYARMIGAEIAQQQAARGLGANRYERTGSELTPGQQLAAKRATSSVSKYKGGPAMDTSGAAAALGSAARWLAKPQEPGITLPAQYGAPKPTASRVKPSAKPSKPVSKRTGAEKKRKAPGAGR